MKERKDERTVRRMDKYSVKIILVVSFSDGFNRVANNRFAEVTEQGYRFHSASPLAITKSNDGKTLFSQTFIFEKGANHEQ